MNRDFAWALLLYIHSAPCFTRCVTLGPFWEAGECNGEGKWSCLLKSPSWIPVLSWGEWSEQPVHKFAGREEISWARGKCAGSRLSPKGDIKNQTMWSPCQFWGESQVGPLWILVTWPSWLWRKILLCRQLWLLHWLAPSQPPPCHQAVKPSNLEKQVSRG